MRNESEDNGEQNGCSPAGFENARSERQDICSN